MQRRRYEILLPLKFNDGQPVPGELFEQCRDELISQFGGISLQPSLVQGSWISSGVRYEDELLRIVIDVEDMVSNREFFAGYKRTLLERFEQVEIYIVSFSVDIL